MALVNGVLVVRVLGHISSNYSVQIPVTIVPGFGMHFVWKGSAATRGVNTIIAGNSYLDMVAFNLPLCEGSPCSSLHHLHLITGATSRTPEAAFPTFSGSSFIPEAVLAVHASTATEATSLPTPAPVNIGHMRFGHPNGQVMAKVKNISECGVNLSDTLSARDTCQGIESTQQKHRKTSRPNLSSEHTTGDAQGDRRIRLHGKTYRPSQQGKRSFFHRRATFSSTNSRLGHFSSKSASVCSTTPASSEAAGRGRFAVHQDCRKGQNKPPGIYFATQHLRSTYGGRMQTFSNLCSTINDFSAENPFYAPKTLKSKLQLRFARPRLTMATAL